jgi:hypothetical protein
MVTFQANEWPPFVDTTANQNPILGIDLTLEVVKQWIAGKKPSVVVPDYAKPDLSDAPSTTAVQD